MRFTTDFKYFNSLDGSSIVKPPDAVGSSLYFAAGAGIFL